MPPSLTPVGCDEQMNFVVHDPQRRPVVLKETLAGHKTGQVIKAYREAVNTGLIEEAVHWSGELVLSGNLWPIWETLFNSAALYYYNHRQLPVYLNDRYIRFRGAASGTADIELRNNSMIRSVIAETSAVLAAGPRQYKATRTHIDDSDFMLDHLRTRIKAPSRDPARPFLLPEDPPEVCMCANEFAHALQVKNLADAQFWAEWLIAFQKRCVKQKQPCVCGVRGAADAPDKLRTTPTLLLWSILRGICQGRPLIDTTVYAWQQLFMVRYTGSVNSVRANLLLAAVVAVCNQTRLITTPPIGNPKLVPGILRGVPAIYCRLCETCELQFVQEERGVNGARGGADADAGVDPHGAGGVGSGIGMLRLLTPNQSHRL